MTAKKTGKSPEKPAASACGCGTGAGCKIEAVLNIDDRGQMVIPKDVREKAGITTSDKLALISWEKNGSVCCLALMKVENLSGAVKDLLGPVIQKKD
ncbi:MAG: HgcAB-associated protein [Methanoregula sp.]|jgi:AbrB family looped-hinge helix DNA binding protein|nr:HgcAB-associated protein [Methanoregula sp.]